MCLKESLRLWAPVPVIARQLTRPMTIDGVTLAPNTTVNINILALHHNPLVWGDDHDVSTFLKPLCRKITIKKWCCSSVH